MPKFTIVDFHTFNTLDRARARAMLDAELEFYKKAAVSMAADVDKMFDALKAGEVVTLGSSAFSGMRIIKEPEAVQAPIDR